MNDRQKTVLITGGTGLIGSPLVQFLSERGFIVRLLSRSRKDTVALKDIRIWDPDRNYIEEGALEGVDSIIHLAGAGIADKYWTKRRKEVIYNSRINSTRFLLQELSKCKNKPKKIISASAIGFYGHQPGERLTEKSPAGTGFLSRICTDWENAATEFKTLGIEVSLIRIGIVLSDKGGTLAALVKASRYFLVPVFGNGRQVVSWIHIDDLINIIHTLLINEKSEGFFNCTSPEPTDYNNLTCQILQSKNKRGFLIHIPTWIVKLLLGDMSELFLSDQHVVPKGILEMNYSYRYQSLKEALNSFYLKNHN